MVVWLCRRLVLVCYVEGWGWFVVEVCDFQRKERCSGWLDMDGFTRSRLDVEICDVQPYFSQ